MWFSLQWPSNNIDQEKKFSLIGLVSILLACISSGFSGVYLEKIMKQAETSMWIRNIQLGKCMVCVYVMDGGTLEHSIR